MRSAIIFLMLIIFGCTDIDFSAPIEVDTSTVEIAIPLFNSQMTIPAISEVSDVDGNIEVLQDGTVQVNYRGDVIRQTSLQIFPPFPGIQDLPIIDTISSIPLPIENNDNIDKAIIGRTNIDFYFATSQDDIITVNLNIPQLTFGEESFSATFTIDNRGGGMGSIRSQQFLIENYIFMPEGNDIVVKYDARTSSNERIILDEARMGFDIFSFKYVEGRFGFRTFDVRGDIITIDIFNNWVSGGITFRDPKVTIEVENAFGLLTKSKFNRMDILTVEGEQLELESPLLADGIDFGFPGFEDVGKAITTYVEFNSGNSNIADLFERKASRVSYDIDALINSENPDFKGFLTDSSYFDIKVEVNLPVDGKVDELVLEETTEVDFSIYDEFNEMELKFDIQNSYPIDMEIQCYFQDASGNILDSLFNDQGLKIEGAPVDSQGIVSEPSYEATNIILDALKIDKILGAESFKVSSRFDTDRYQRNVRLLENYSLDLYIGAIIKLK